MSGESSSAGPSSASKEEVKADSGDTMSGESSSAGPSSASKEEVKADSDIGKSVTIPETGTVVTMYPNTAESVATNGTKVTLHGRDLWSEFHKCTNEMIISKAGRRMFPVVRVSVSGLNPIDKYAIVMDIVPVGDNRYKFYNSEWVITGEVEPMGNERGRFYIHPNSPATGAILAKQLFTFQKCKLTKDLDKLGYIVLNSMHKYQPRIHVVKTNEDQTFSMQQKISENFSTHIFPETQFMSVTTYQSHQITQLKIKYNPFAKGYRCSKLCESGPIGCCGSDPKGSSSTSGTSTYRSSSTSGTSTHRSSSTSGTSTHRSCSTSSPPPLIEFSGYDPVRTAMWQEMTFPQQPTILSPHTPLPLPGPHTPLPLPGPHTQSALLYQAHGMYRSVANQLALTSTRYSQAPSGYIPKATTTSFAYLPSQPYYISSNTPQNSRHHDSTFHPRQDIQSLATYRQVLTAGLPRAACISGTPSGQLSTMASRLNVGYGPLNTTSLYSAQSMQQLPLIPSTQCTAHLQHDTTCSSPHSQHSTESRH